MSRIAACLSALLLAAAVAQPAPAQAAEAPSCLVVYGHGRNIGSADENAAWDRINGLFNRQVSEQLQAHGLRAVPLLFRVGETELAAAVEQLVDAARRQDCPRVVDTTVFADETAGRLIVRLRVHPLLAGGPRAQAAARIGTPLYTSQNDFDLNRPLDRLQLDLLARQMVDGYLADRPPATDPR